MDINIIHNNGYKAFFTDERINEVNSIIESANQTIFFPRKCDVFRFLRVPFNKIKCVFLGMEPYASWFYDENGDVIPQATGRSFEVASVNDWNQKFKQSSLRNILKSLYYLHTEKNESLEVIREKINSGIFPVSQPHEWFDEMEKQGVVFLNASLTVEKDVPDSHRALWDNFMTELIKYINQNNPGIMWVLAGVKAQDRASDLVDNSIKCSHPRISNFVEECPFKHINNINWIR